MFSFKRNKHLILTTVAANTFAFIIGTAITWSSPIIAILESDDISKIPLGRQITDDEESWIGSLINIGGLLSPLLFGFLLQTIGRKKTLVMIPFPILVAYLISAFAKNIWLYYIARFLMGLGMGGAYIISVIYYIEITEAFNRGFVGATVITFMTFGELFSYCLGPYVSIMVFNLVLAGICAASIPFFWYVAPESPYYLASINKEEEALKSLQYLRQKSDEDVQNELNAIKSHLQQQTKQASIMQIFETKASRKALVIGMFLGLFQQLCGVNVVLYYAQKIFDDSGSDIPPEICSIIIGFVQFIISTIFPPFLDRFGRKILLLITVSGAVVSQTVLGAYLYIKDDGTDVSSISWLPVVSLVGFIVSYNFGMASIPWTLLGEIAPSNVSSKISTIVTLFYAVVGFVMTKFFVNLTDGIGMAGSFWLFGGFCVFYDLFVFFFVFETKGKSLQEIEDIMNR